MAWQNIPNNPYWQYDDAPLDPGGAETALWATSTNGVRLSVRGEEIYVNCRHKLLHPTQDSFPNEINKTFWTGPLLFTVDTSLGSDLIVGFDSAQVYDATIDWGDGSNPLTVGPGEGTVTKQYSSVGTYQVRVSGTFAPEIILSSNQNIVSVENLGTLGYVDLSNMFRNCQNLVSFNAGKTDTSSVTDLTGMFTDCISLSSANVSTLDTSNVTIINSMFQGCNSLTTLVLSNWDTSNVGYFVNAFRGCTSLETLLLPDNFVTSNALQITSVFYDCQSLQSLDVSTWDTSNVRRMTAIFVRCFGLTDIVGLETNISINGLNVTDGLTNTANGVPNQGTDYDALLINWEANLPTSGLAQSPRFNLSKVTTTAGNNARISLINNYNWVVLDGGPL